MIERGGHGREVSKTNGPTERTQRERERERERERGCVRERQSRESEIKVVEADPIFK